MQTQLLIVIVAEKKALT